MKKQILIMLCMIFALCKAYAQNVEQLDTLISSSSEQTAQNVASLNTGFPEVSSLIGTFAQGTIDGTLTVAPSGRIVMPIVGKSKFAKKHYIYQTVDISTVGGKNKSSDDPDDDGSSKAGAAASEVGSILSGANFGMNFGYSIIFVPGNIKEDGLEINRFGFAYSTGFLASFDTKNESGVAFDFLWKLGLEVGNEHLLGIGLDAMVGGGKSIGAIYPLEFDVDTDPYNYTDWCFKFGGQVWIKTNLLSTGIKNSDILIFARFIYSKDPHNPEYQSPNVYNYWMEEAWKFGVTLRYRF